MKKYIRFYGDKTWYEVLKTKEGYVLYYDPSYESTLWQRIEWVEEEADKIPFKRGGIRL